MCFHWGHHKGSIKLEAETVTWPFGASHATEPIRGKKKWLNILASMIDPDPQGKTRLLLYDGSMISNSGIQQILGDPSLYSYVL